MSPSLLSNFDCAEKKKRNLNPYSQHCTGAMGVGVRHFDELSRSCHMIFGKSCSHDVVQLKSKEWEIFLFFHAFRTIITHH